LTRRYYASLPFVNDIFTDVVATCSDRANGNVICQGVAMTTLPMQDKRRIEIVERVFRDELTVLRAAVTLGAGRATVLIKQRVHEEGLKAVIHANRDPAL
jgi:hypothetical protein